MSETMNNFQHDHVEKESNPQQVIHNGDLIINVHSPMEHINREKTEIKSRDIPTDISYLTPSELQQIQSDPASFKQVFLANKTRLLADLGPKFANISQEGAAIIFSGIVAYELKPYRLSNTPAPASWRLNDLLAVPALLCNEYVSLSIQLFYLAYPQNSSSQIKINGVGWRRDSPLTNHAQFLVTGVNVPLLMDPTLGSVAIATMNDLYLQKMVPADSIKELTMRSELMTFRTMARNALLNGTYNANYLIYSFLSSDVGQPGGLRPYYLWSDFTNSVAKGPNNRYWYTTGAGALWEVNQNGILLASTGGTDQIATGLNGNAIYFRTSYGALYYRTPDISWTLLRNNVSSLASGTNGAIVLPLYQNSDLWNISNSGWLFAGSYVNSIATGLSNVGVYELTLGNELYVYKVNDWFSVEKGIIWITGEKNRLGIYYLSNSNELYQINGDGISKLLMEKVQKVLLGIGGLTLNVLTTDGMVMQGDLQSSDGVVNWNSGNFKWTQLWSGSLFTAISLQYGGVVLCATRSDGTQLTASASTY